MAGLHHLVKDQAPANLPILLGVVSDHHGRLEDLRFRPRQRLCLGLEPDDQGKTSEEFNCWDLGKAVRGNALDAPSCLLRAKSFEIHHDSLV